MRHIFFFLCHVRLKHLIIKHPSFAGYSVTMPVTMPAFHISCLLFVAAALEPTRRMQPSKAFLRQVHLNTSLATATVALEPTAAPTVGCSADTVDYNALNVSDAGCCAYDAQCISKFCGAAWKCAAAPASPSSTPQTVSIQGARCFCVVVLEYSPNRFICRGSQGLGKGALVCFVLR